MAYPSRFVEFFGPCMWKTMHAVAHSYPVKPDEDTRRKYIDFFRALADVIPCPSCGDHYEQYLHKHPIDASSRDSLARWVYDLHSDVNARKKNPNPSFEEVKAQYEGWTPEKSKRLESLPRAKMRAEMATPLLPMGVDALGGSAPSGRPLGHPVEGPRGLWSSSSSPLLLGSSSEATRYLVYALVAFAAVFLLQRMRMHSRQSHARDRAESSG